MREIKFRIWDKDKNIMRYLDSDPFDSTDFIKANKDGRLMIDTGIKDIEGRLIYEGDYVSVYNTYKEAYYKGKIKYISSRCEFAIESSSLTTHKRWINYELKVLGNIFENPGFLVSET